MIEIVESRGQVGGVDPIVGQRVTGWTRLGAGVTLFVDDMKVESAIADRPRMPPASSEIGEIGGFSLRLPVFALDGQHHSIKVIRHDGVELTGARLFRVVGGVSGRIDSVARGVLKGHVTVGADCGQEQIAVAATVGDEVVAIAVTRANNQSTDTTKRVFSLILPHDMSAQGHRIVHVAVVGGPALIGSPAVLPRMADTRVHIRQQVRPVSIAIKISAPSLTVAQEWGDYHYARHIGAALQRRGWIARVDCADEWARTGDDATLVLRGRHRYRTDPNAVNIMWLISHPDRLVADETRDFAHIFVASDIHARTLTRLTPTPVSALHQAADPRVFRPPLVQMPPAASALFVGNSRKEYRKIVKWCVEAGVEVAIFGSLWEGIVPASLVHGVHISNDDLHVWYGSCPVLLNDHWDTMRDSGFLSNRLFDGSAAGAFIITDPVRGLASVFGDAIETADSAKELKAKVDYYIANPAERAKRASAARKIVLEGHTFDHRALKIIEVYEQARDSVGTKAKSA